MTDEKSVNEKPKQIAAPKKPIRSLSPLFRDIIGQDEAVKRLSDACLSFQNRKLLSYMGLKSPKGALLYGPSGVGKTYLATAYANESDGFFYVVNLATIGSCYVNQTANNLLQAQELAIKTSDKQGYGGLVTLFFDECETIMGKRHGGSGGGKEDDKSANTLCELMDGALADDRVFFIASTNRRDLIDDAFLRAGRFDYQVEFKKPDKTDLEALFRHYSGTMVRTDGGTNFSGLNHSELAKEAVGFSGADVAYVMKECLRQYVLGMIRSDNPIESIKPIRHKVLLDAVMDYQKRKCTDKGCSKIGYDTG